MTHIRRFARWLAKHLDAFGRVSDVAPYIFEPLSVERAVALRALMARGGNDSRIRDAVTVGLATSGLPATASDNFDIARYGKTHEVLHHAFDYLGIDNQLRTVGDVVKFLSEHA